MKVTRERQQTAERSGAGATSDPPEERLAQVRRLPGRNPGAPLDLELVSALRVNRSAVERRAATIPTRRTVQKQWQAAWLLRALHCIDLTTLQGHTTPGN